MSETRMFPIQSERGAAPHPTCIPWSVAERAYSVYSARYGKGQSLERMAERGGFGPGEMDDFLPGWREEVSEIASLREVLAGLQKEADGQRQARDSAESALAQALLAKDSAIQRANSESARADKAESALAKARAEVAAINASLVSSVKLRLASLDRDEAAESQRDRAVEVLRRVTEIAASDVDPPTRMDRMARAARKALAALLKEVT